MAHTLQAVHAYDPRTDLRPPLTSDQIAAITIDATYRSWSSVISPPVKLDGVIEFDLHSSLPIHIHTLNCIICTPSLDLAGELKAKVRPHPELTAALNQKDAFRGNLVNTENIGRTMDELIAVWNVGHPDDLFE